MVQFQTVPCSTNLLCTHDRSPYEPVCKAGLGLRFEFGKAQQGSVAAFGSLTLSHTRASTASANGLQLLPIGSNRGGKQQQFAWDGNKVIAINKDLLDEGYTAAGRLQDFISRLQERVMFSFLPRKEDVTDDYWEWLKWRLGQRFFSATLQNFATQSLLMAVGVGARKALAASAAINWMLKDGMNRIVRMSVATQFGDSFDSDLKRFRFTTSMLFTACVTGEFLTPMYPQHFLLLAAISNVGRAVGLTTFVSTQPAFQQALCASGNMADLASKTQAQHMVMDTLALAVSATANYVLRHKEAQRMMLPLVAFPICGIMDLFCIYNELKAVQLRSLNRERAEMVAEHWLQTGKAPTFQDISRKESLLGPPNIAHNLLPMRLLPLEHTVSSPAALKQLLHCYSNSKYILAVQRGEQLPWWHLWERCFEQYKSAPHIAVTLQKGAQPRDILTAVLEAAYIRKQLQQDQVLRQQQEACCSSSSKQQQVQHQGVRSDSRCHCHDRQEHEQNKALLLPVEELRVTCAGLPCTSDVRKQCRRQAEQRLSKFLHDLECQGWQLTPFLLSSREKSGFVKL